MLFPPGYFSRRWLARLLAISLAAGALLNVSSFAHADLLIASFENDKVLRYDSSTGAYLGTVVAGGGGLDAPVGLAIGADNLLYVSGKFSNNILRYDSITGAFVDEFVRNALNGTDSPSNIHFGSNGNLLAASWGLNSVREYDANTGALVGVVASDPSLHDPLDFAYGPTGDLFVTGSVDVGSSNAIFQFAAGTGELIRTVGAVFGRSSPSNITFGPDGNLYVALESFSEVVRYDGSTLAFLGVFAHVQRASGLAFGPDGNLYVASTFDNSVVRLDGQTGAFIDTFVAPGSGGLLIPKTILFTKPVPEPATLALAASGMLFGLIVRCHARRK